LTFKSGENVRIEFEFELHHIPIIITARTNWNDTVVQMPQEHFAHRHVSK